MTGDRVVRPTATPPGPGSASWTRRLILLAVGLALVLMHHVIGAHQHTPTEPDPVAGTASHEQGHATASPTAALHVHHNDGGHDTAAMLHDCLAVLAAAAALALVLWLLRGGVVLTRDGSPPSPTTLRPGRPRPPAPVPVLLAQLQVLRL